MVSKKIISQFDIACEKPATIVYEIRCSPFYKICSSSENKIWGNCCFMAKILRRIILSNVFTRNIESTDDLLYSNQHTNNFLGTFFPVKFIFPGTICLIYLWGYEGNGVELIAYISACLEFSLFDLMLMGRLVRLYYTIFFNDLSVMTSSNGNIFHVTGPLCGEFTGHRWIPP